MVAALVEVQTFGGGVGADKNEVFLFAKAVGDIGAGFFVVLTAHGEDRAYGGSLQGCDQRGLAVGVFGVDEDARARLLGADGLHLGDDSGQFGVLGDGGFCNADEFVERIGHVGEAANVAGIG